MIQHFPVDFSTSTYDVKTNDDLLWQFVQDDQGCALVSGELRQPLLTSSNKPTFFTPDYTNINIHGFTVGDIHRTIVEVIPNANWVAPEVPQTADELEEPLFLKEKAFALKLKELADKFNINLMSLPDVNIGALLGAAQEAGATELEIASASAILLALAKDVEAESGLVWSDTWLGLKSRLMSYLTS